MDAQRSSRIQLLEHAKDFIEEMASDARWGRSKQDTEQRWARIQQDIKNTGTYAHTEEELIFGAQWAWRNSNRCIGRHMWRSLNVRDARSVIHVDDVIQALGDHIKAAWNGGQIQSHITIFAPRHPEHALDADPVRIGNQQLTRYAGFRQADGTVVGDPDSVALTQRLQDQGWTGPNTPDAFVPLPWSIWTNDQEHAPIDVFAQHPDWLYEVDLTHQELADFKTLGLKWYAVPSISEMALVIGGITYPCAPFNGWYMGTEIGARNLADENRYHVLPDVAKCMGITTSSPRTLWKDRALIELNRAVLHSFDRAGVTIGDHHELGAQFEKFCQVEEKNYRPLTGDWHWLTPPISGPTTPQFHREFDGHVVPHTNYFYQSPPPTDRAARAKQPEPPHTPHVDPYHLGHRHPTPSCPFGHG